MNRSDIGECLIVIIAWNSREEIAIYGYSPYNEGEKRNGIHDKCQDRVWGCRNSDEEALAKK
ncbi:MAG: hypothetical protein PT947_02075 [Suipraeoptans intestinalis]|nr:hypothetical protein [Suipraeoptans intestinalis]